MSDHIEPNSLKDLRRASARREAAQRDYVSALVACVDELQAAGMRDYFARAASASGVSKQACRELYMRAKGTWKQ
jgi:hypothetical protein